MAGGFTDEWDDLTASCFEFLSDPATYIRGDTKVAKDVGVITLDEAESWNAKGLEVKGNNVVCRVFAAEIAPDEPDWSPLDTDVVVYKGRRYTVRPQRNELNGAFVVHLSKSSR